MEITFPTTIPEFVIWLGSSAAGGVILSLLLERISAFKNWKSPLKGYAVIALFIALPILSSVLGSFVAAINPALLAEVQKYLNLALAGLTAWGVSQFSHAQDSETFKE